MGGAVLVSLGTSLAISRLNDDGAVNLGQPGSYAEPQPIGTAPNLTGQALPDLPVTDLEGAASSLASVRGPAVVNLWATTCTACRAEMADFESVHQELGSTVRFIGLNVSDPVDRAESYARDVGISYDLLVDPTHNDIATALKVPALPATLFVDRTGTVRDLHLGALDATRLRSLVTDRLGV